ncbi:MAG: amino acid--tRNA ligase-related protein, partial [Pseudomonadota bacterium]|nr:amino acid--tRNA ligase-related protein [Pseudomonadota bacterium]
MSDASYRDAIFSTPLDKVARFSFDEQVVACFPDMIRRSVPGYGQILGMLSLIAKRHLRHGAHVYDLGCSLGASGLALAGAMPADAFRYTGIDLSPAMVERARQTFLDESPDHAMQVEEADIRTYAYAPSGMIILNFTLQFLPPADRDALLNAAKKLGIKRAETLPLGYLQMEVFEAAAEEHLIQPTFVTDFPLDVSPLSRKKDDDPTMVDRFELYIAGRELCNAFSELNDPDDQRSRFEAQVAQRATGDEEAHPM